MLSSVSVSELHKHYDYIHALKGITFSVPQGCLYGIIGADGAGKTTLMRILATLINADSGNILVMNKDITDSYQYIRSHLGYMPQRFSLYQDLTVRENLLFFADVYGVKAQQRRERLTKLLSFSRLEPFQKRRAAHLSGGMKQKLALSCALIHTPTLLILDEPTTGVDPVSRNEFWDILQELRNQGITIIVSTPYMDEASMCDHLLILHKGEILNTGSPASLLKTYPFKLYSATSSSTTVSFRTPPRLPEIIKYLYPSAGMMHAVIEQDDLSREAIFAELKTVLPEIDTVDQIQPSIEDLFILLISEKEKR